MLAYYTANGDKPDCDQRPATAVDRAWLTLYVGDGADPAHVQRQLGWHPGASGSGPAVLASQAAGLTYQVTAAADDRRSAGLRKQRQRGVERNELWRGARPDGPCTRRRWSSQQGSRSGPGQGDAVLCFVRPAEMRDHPVTTRPPAGGRRYL